MSLDQNFDFTNPMKEVEIDGVQKHSYKKVVKTALNGKGKTSLHHTILGFILLSLLTLALVYLLNQKEKVNQVENILKTSSSVSTSPIVYTGSNYSIIFKAKPNLLIVRNKDVVDSTLVKDLQAARDIWLQKEEGTDKKVLEIQVLENNPNLEFEKLVSEFKINNGFAENEVTFDETSQGFKRVKLGEKYQIIQSKFNTYLINLEGEQKGVQQTVLENIQFN